MPAPKLITDRFVIADMENDLIGRGSMGDVYLGADLATNQIVAIKVLNSHIVQRHPDAVARFLREGEALSQLNHPNIVTIIATIEEDNQYYLIMEYVAGGSLYDLLKRQKQLPQEQVLNIGLELTDALTRTHHLNIIHRDLKPANVLLKTDGTPLLSDFGIALVMRDTRLTQGSVVIGTPAYLSPEAWDNKPLDGRADLWSLGVMLYEMLAGRLPFPGETYGEIIQALVRQDIPDLKKYRPDINPALEDLIYRLLAKNREARVYSARVLGAELEAIRQGRQISVPKHLPPSTVQLSFSQDSEQPAPERQNLTRLRELIVEHFGSDDLKTLCFDLGVNYDELSGDMLNVKVQGLILYCQRRGSLNKLIQLCEKHRPHLSWPHFPGSTDTPLNATDDKPPEWLPIHYESPGIRARPRRFFGQDEPIRHIQQMLDDKQVVLLHGLGGMGKTALAATVADQRLEEGKGSVIWMQPGQEDAVAIFEALLKAFATEEEKRKIGPLKLPLNAQTDALRQIVDRTGAHLLVIDDASDGPTLHAMLEMVPRQMAVLVTSRRKIPLEQIVQIEALAPSAAVGLLAYHAGNIDLRGDESAFALCRLLGFHPYTIKIAGATLKVDSLTCQELIEKIQVAPYDLVMPEGFDESHRRGMKPILDDSFQALSYEGKSVFRAIGAFFARGATGGLLAAFLQINSQAIEVGLTELVRRSLVNRHHRTDRFSNQSKHIAYYTMHDLTYYYARALSEDGAKRNNSAILAVKQYVMDHARNLDELFFEQGNIVGAMEQSQTDNPDALIEIMRVLVMQGYFDRFGYTLQFQQLMASTLQVLQPRDKEPELQHYLWGKIGNAYYDQGDFDQAFAAYQNALRLAPNSKRETILLAVIARTRNAQGLYVEADQYFRDAVRQADESGGAATLSFVFQQQAIVAGSRQDYASAQEYAQKGIELLAQVGDRVGEGYLKLMLGSTELDMRQDAYNALLYHRQAYQIAQEENDLVLTAYVSFALGQDYYALQAYAEMMSYLNEARNIFHQTGHTTRENEVITFIKTANNAIKD